MSIVGVLSKNTTFRIAVKKRGGGDIRFDGLILFLDIDIGVIRQRMRNRNRIDMRFKTL